MTAKRLDLPRLRSIGIAALASAVVASTLGIIQTTAASAAGSSCGATINPVVCENQLPGTPASTWDIDGSGDPNIQGFSTDISVNAGSSIGFKIKTNGQYTIDIYRLGYYGGNGAALKQANLSHVAPVTQPTCLNDTSTGLFDCGNWSLSSTWSVPSSAVSGVYLAKLTKTDGSGAASHITFVVRNDASTSDVVYQTSDTTWQAYNRYGGYNFYTGSTVDMYDSKSRARKISYNRPFATRDDNSGRDFLFANEYPAIRYLEQSGFDVSYISGVDTDRYGATQLTKHKVFLDVGHDEYWSAAQRTNVLNARDAGVNLMFLSGNSMYWRTRYENSIDGSNTTYRTLVSYKATWDITNTNASFTNSDPSGEYTGTWRDPRVASTNGTIAATPENALIGTAYESNASDYPVTVTAAQGKTRLWRNTGLSSMGGSATALAPHTVGYESDEDLDNGFRPAGLVQLSTVTAATAQELLDFGNTVAAGTTTHHLTMYKAASGARVFSAGSIQWAWGLDANHDGDTSGGTDVRMRQATLNMLVDMGAQPGSIASDLVATTKTTDTTAPTVTVTSPVNGASVGDGTAVTVSGTASDVGGSVAGVEVSMDGGTSWHAATGTTSWSYTAPAFGGDTATIQVRAADDSGNISTPTSLSVSTPCPCSIFGNITPNKADFGDSYAYEPGVRFTADTPGSVTGIRFYKAASNTGTHTGTLWTATGSLIATGTFTNETASGWQTLNFATPIKITAGTTYVASYYAPNGHYSKDIGTFFYRDVNSSPLHAESYSTAAPLQKNGVYNYAGDKFPTYNDLQGANYYVDVNFATAANEPLTVLSTSPSAGATNVAPGQAIGASFSKAITPASLAFTLTGPGGSLVAGTTSYNATTLTASFKPNAKLALNTVYTATASANDSKGVAMAAPYTWSFTISAINPAPTVVNANPSDGTTSVSLTVVPTASFSDDMDPATVAFSLKDQSGNAVAGVADYDSASRSATFTPAAALTAGVRYLASAFAKDLTGAAMSAPYSWAFTTVAGAAITGPSAVSTSPLNIATSVAVSVTPSAVLSTSIAPASLVFTLKDSSGNAVAGTASYDNTTTTATFTPASPLTRGVTYTASVSGTDTSGTASSAPSVWSFTTAQPSPTPGVCPCGMWDDAATPDSVTINDGHSVELGMQFTADRAGQVAGLRFYKGPKNTGVHSGSLWGADGTLLATGTFSAESSTGWQTLYFGTPVPTTAGTTYVVSYHTNVGFYSETYGGAFAGTGLDNSPLHTPAHAGFYLYGAGFPTGTSNSNYWIDPVFNSTASAPGDTTPPSVTAVTPVNNSTSVAVDSVLTAKFSENIDPTTLAFNLKTAANEAVAGTATFDSTTQTATFTPAARLANNTGYIASVGASDVAGNAMTAPTTWSFTTILAPKSGYPCPCSMWNQAALPDNPTVSDGHAIELGVTFTADVNGEIDGVRFFKGPKNTGTHTGTLWTAAGQQLATATFSNESASGWQTVTFARPVLVTANTSYIVSYNTTAGFYSETYGGAFASTGIDNAPLHMPAHPALFLYGGGFPTNGSNSNYWVDPVFNDQITIPAPVISNVTSTVNGAAHSVTINWITDVASSSSVSYGTASGSLTSTATAAGNGTSHSVTITGLAEVTTYYFRVNSTDPTTNLTATSPNASLAPLSFTTPDVTAPTITNVASTGSGTSATITWTTNEASTSSVSYGTASGSLTSTATAAGLTTTHTVVLTGLTINTRYYFRVTSADASNNSTTSPATSGAPAVYIPPPGSVTSTTSADFAAGTVSSTYVAANGDGEVVLTPTAVQEFTATTAPSGWTSTTLVTGGTTTYSNGNAVIDGTQLQNSTAYSGSTSMEFQGKLEKSDVVGFFNSSTNKIQFSVDSTGKLVATANDAQGDNNTSAALVPASGSYVDTVHKYRIEYNKGTSPFIFMAYTGSVTFFIDDVQVYTATFKTAYSGAATYKPTFADNTRGTGDLAMALDWVRVGPYAATGTYTSKVFDASAPVTWGALTWDAAVPTGTTMVVKVRTGNTATPDGTWSAYTTVAASGGSIGATAKRYMQYQITFTTTTTLKSTTPTLRSIGAAYQG